ncbi:uncharacterized protein SAMN06265365_101215 [Tistlia consotensis]|uniref:Uncharacterized protein n=1 Tax=Tistlia consotensis USBA 355 TaxID=560819 RepID=A0A1Y6B5W4_9PROT|nr:hypothetical protein [Tistlia consotensis]SME89461.1 uncharacterized protein SAMN05428998_101213 [Tistlia consotensis USBA 355]SNR25990.1 uncharacterized protein SAMN06265365_101215 [Tistlia consotensis]
MTLRRRGSYNAGMFGLPSIQKLIVLAAIVAAVWYGFKFIGRIAEQREAERKLRERQRGDGGRGPGGGRPQGAERAAEIKAEEMVPCPACGAYVASRRARNCGRADCPY